VKGLLQKPTARAVAPASVDARRFTAAQADASGHRQACRGDAGRRGAGRHGAGQRSEAASILRAFVGGLWVMKFGGTSVADAERIKRAAGPHRSPKKEAGSPRRRRALGPAARRPNRLIADAFEISSNPDAPRRWTCCSRTGRAAVPCRALCAMAIKRPRAPGHLLDGVTGRAIVTDTSHTKGRASSRCGPIGSAEGARFRPDPCSSPDSRAFRRRATSTTASAAAASDTTSRSPLAAAVGADECEDLQPTSPAVFSADPRIVKRRAPKAADGSASRRCSRWPPRAPACSSWRSRRVTRRNHGVAPSTCRSSFDDGPGTVVVGEDITVEQPSINRRHALPPGRARVTLRGRPRTSPASRRAGSPWRWPTPTSTIDMIVQKRAALGGLARGDVVSPWPARGPSQTAQSAADGGLRYGELENR